MAGFAVPDVLVLAGGGIVGEAWMTGVLAGIEDAADVDLRGVESIVGTSAGAIVGARLAAGQRPRRPSEAPPAEQAGSASGGGALRDVMRAAWAATAPLASLAVAATAPGGAKVRAAVLARAPTDGRSLDDLHAAVERWGTRFDGRLRVCCVEKASGRRVVFGAPGEPSATVADAVTASCALPWVFAPITIDDRTYVDGAVWSIANLDAAPAGRESEVLCLDPTGALRSPLWQALRVSVAIEVQLLRRRGVRLTHVRPDPTSARAMGDDLMATAPAAAAMAAGYRQGRALVEA